MNAGFRTANLQFSLDTISIARAIAVAAHGYRQTLDETEVQAHPIPLNPIFTPADGRTAKHRKRPLITSKITLRWDANGSRFRDI